MVLILLLTTLTTCLLTLHKNEVHTPEKWLYEKQDWGGFIGKNTTDLKKVLKPTSLVVFQSIREHCNTTSNCFVTMRRLKRKFRDNICNFLIAPDNSAYVFAGWDHYLWSNLYQKALCVGFLTGGGHISEKMTKTAKALLDRGVTLAKLIGNFSVVAGNQTSRNVDDDDLVYSAIKDWPNFTAETFYNPDEVLLKFSKKYKAMQATAKTTTEAVIVQETQWFFSKRDWNAREVKQKSENKITQPIKYIIFGNWHGYYCRWSSDCMQILRIIQRQDLSVSYDDLRCNFLIAIDGNVYEGTGWDFYVPKARNGYYVMFLGSRNITSAMVNSAADWINLGISLGKIDPDYNVTIDGREDNSLYETVKQLPRFIE